MSKLNFDFEQFVKHELLKGGIKLFTGKDSKKYTAKIHSLGETEKYFLLSACQLAMEEFGVKKEDILKIARVLKEMNREKRNRIINNIGHDEQEFVIEEIIKEGEKIITKRKIEKKNLRGAKIIAFLSKMTEQEMFDYLEGFGVLDTFSENLEEMIEKIDEKFKISKTIKEVDDFVGENLNFKKIITEHVENLEKKPKFKDDWWGWIKKTLW